MIVLQNVCFFILCDVDSDVPYFHFIITQCHLLWPLNCTTHLQCYSMKILRKRSLLLLFFSICFWGILIHQMVPEWEWWCHRPFTVSITHRESNLLWFSCLLRLFPLTPKSHSTWQSLAGLVLRALPIKSEFLVLTLTECSLIGDCSIVGGSRHNILGSYLNINLFVMSVTVNWQYKH